MLKLLILQVHLGISTITIPRLHIRKPRYRIVSDLPKPKITGNFNHMEHISNYLLGKTVFIIMVMISLY